MVLNGHLHILSYKFPDIVLTQVCIYEEIRKVFFDGQRPFVLGIDFRAMDFYEDFMFLNQVVGRGETGINYFLFSDRPFHSVFKAGRLTSEQC